MTGPKRFRRYFDKLSSPERQALAEQCGTSIEYLRLIASGRRNPKAELAVALERESGGAVTLEDLMPAVDWAYVRSRPDVSVNA